MKKKILLIITGGIAAYKSLDLIRKFREEGCDITCILTKSGSEFVTPLSIESLSENRVYTDLFNLTDEHQMGHIQLARMADVLLVAPATANIISKYDSNRKIILMILSLILQRYLFNNSIFFFLSSKISNETSEILSSIIVIHSPSELY